MLRIRRWREVFSKRSENRSHGVKNWMQLQLSPIMGQKDRKKELTEEEKVSMLKMLGSEVDKMFQSQQVGLSIYLLATGEGSLILLMEEIRLINQLLICSLSHN